jgi:hypothetical protein
MSLSEFYPRRESHHSLGDHKRLAIANSLCNDSSEKQKKR